MKGGGEHSLMLGAADAEPESARGARGLASVVEPHAASQLLELRLTPPHLVPRLRQLSLETRRLSHVQGLDPLLENQHHMYTSSM